MVATFNIIIRSILLLCHVHVHSHIYTHAFIQGATTISDRIPVLKPYTKWIFTDEGGTTQRVPQTHNISWHVPDDDMRSQEALWYPPEYNMSHNDDISMRSQVSVIINITV